MIALVCFIWSVSTAPVQVEEPAGVGERRTSAPGSRAAKKVRDRIEFTNVDRLFFILLYRWCPSVLKAMVIVRPETVLRWLASGWLSSLLALEIAGRGRPPISAQLRGLIRRMSVENVLWGAPRIQGDLLKLGFAVAHSTVAKYMAKRDDPSGQSWSTFPRNHAPHIAAMDLFVVPTIGLLSSMYW